ncbi:MAG: putative transcriptional regulator [Glaciecola sp.]|jgi:putative transcriptional regulator
MIRILLMQRLDDKSFKEQKRITLKEVQEKTKIGRATLTRIANEPGYSVSTNTIDKLCDYFDCDVSDLLVRVPDR